MAWRRFTQGSFGALSAKQYTEVQDTVQALASVAGVSSGRAALGVRPILVRLKSKFGASPQEGAGSVSGSSRIRAQAYNFRQAHVRISDAGVVEVAERDYGLASDPPSGGDDAQRLLAIDFGARDHPQNTLALIMPIAVDAGAGAVELPSRQGLYAIVQVIGDDGAAVDRYTITGASATGYTGTRVGGGGTVQIVNLYEVSSYYGALDPPQNPCAVLEPRLIPTGSVVFGFTVGSGSTVYTCAPNAFTVRCQGCGAVAESMQAMYDSVGAESAVASRMLGG